MRSLGTFVATSCLAVLAASNASAETRAQFIEKGRVILEANCARCHGIGKDDASKHPEAPPFREVVKRYPPENLAEALAEGISSGHPDMPEFVFQSPEIEAIVSYLGTLAPLKAMAK
jgi:mono/diheme cytochrome c family protein